jgi:hypothetical protein
LEAGLSDDIPSFELGGREWADRALRFVDPAAWRDDRLHELEALVDAVLPDIHIRIRRGEFEPGFTAPLLGQAIEQKASVHGHDSLPGECPDQLIHSQIVFLRHLESKRACAHYYQGPVAGAEG